MLHKETVEPATLGLLTALMALPELDQFRLVGGTALSLLLGHRASIDLDLFTDKQFDREEIIDTLKRSFNSVSFAEFKSNRLFFATINNVKVDFVNTFEAFVNDSELKEHIRFASIEDVVALKLNAIAGRGAKKDFWDVYELLNHYSFKEMMNMYHKRYPDHSAMMVLKSITYFENADIQPDPDCFRKLSWKHVKKEITKKINTYINNS